MGPVSEQSEMRAQPDPSRPCPAPIRYIPEIFIKNILHNDIFPGHSSSLMILVIISEIIHLLKKKLSLYISLIALNFAYDMYL